MAPRSMANLPSRITLTHGLMVVAALLTFVGVSSVLRDRAETVDVLVAATSIQSGATVLPTQLDVVTVRAADPLVEHFVRPADFVGGQAGRTIGAGEPVLSGDVVPIESGLGVRTFSLPIDERVVDGLGLLAGDRVDVVGFDTDGWIGVVAADLKVTRLPGSGSPGNFGGSLGPMFLTVEVTTQQVLRLVEALRVDDVEIVRSTGAPTLSPDLSSENSLENRVTNSEGGA